MSLEFADGGPTEVDRYAMCAAAEWLTDHDFTVGLANGPGVDHD